MKRLIGIVENVFIKVDEFIFLVSVIIMETEPTSNLRSQIPILLGRLLYVTPNTLTSYRIGLMKLWFGSMIVVLNIFNMDKQSQVHLPMLMMW